MLVNIKAVFLIIALSIPAFIIPEAKAENHSASKINSQLLNSGNQSKQFTINPSITFDRTKQINYLAQANQGWSSQVVNGVSLTVEKIEKADGGIRVYMKAENQTNQDTQLHLHFNQFYAYDDIGNSYGYVPSLFPGGSKWGGIIPASGIARGYVTLPPVDPNASTITINFGSYPVFSGNKISVTVPIR